MMSDRERWIVYPLLVLALALAIKGRYDAWQGTSQFNAITCRSLLIVNELGEAQAILQQDEQGNAELSLAGPEGQIEASLTTGLGGGQLVLVRRPDQTAIVFGHDKMREATGLWAIDRTEDGPPTPLLIETGDDQIWDVLPWPIDLVPEKEIAKDKTKK